MKSFLSFVLAVSLSHFGAPALAAEPTGEFWEMTTKMEMAGMPAGMGGMAMAPQKVCMLKGQESKPVKTSPDDNCTMSNVKQSGNTMTFDMKCTGKNAMTGSGEITSTPGSFNQRVKMKVDGEDMTIVSTGKRVGGACKGDEQINQAFAGAAGAAETNARNCQAALDKNEYGAFLKAVEKLGGDRKAQCAAMPTAESRKNCEAASDFGCAKLRPQMCARLGADLKSKDRFVQFAHKGVPLAEECGLAPEKIVEQYCTAGLDQKDWRFVADYCQKDSRVAALKTQHCIGRDYTSVAASQREMCSTIGGLSLAKAGSADAADAGAKPAARNEAAKPGALEEAKKSGAKVLKDLFKF
jgi:Protein of unknown function (DUF3617)